MTNLEKYKTIIADDEQPARERLKQLLSQFREIELIGEAANGTETVEMVDRLKPDLLFLDIQMPGCNGFEALQQVSHFPVVVFCTAYDDYALQAFETSAIDYIVKPVKAERVQKTIEKLTLLKANPDKEQLLKIVTSLINQSPKKEITSIPVRLGDRMLFIKLDDISYFSAEEKYVAIVTSDGKKHLTEHSLKYLEDKLDGKFIRIHRSLLINPRKIKEIHKHFGSRFILKMDDYNQTRLVSGRNYSDQIRGMLEL